MTNAMVANTSSGSKRLALCEPPDGNEGDQSHAYDHIVWGDEEGLDDETSGDDGLGDGGILVDNNDTEAYKGDLMGAAGGDYEHAAGGGGIYSLLNECGGHSPLQDRC
jgi:hypothetical protein